MAKDKVILDQVQRGAVALKEKADLLEAEINDVKNYCLNAIEDLEPAYKE